MIGMGVGGMVVGAGVGVGGMVVGVGVTVGGMGVGGMVVGEGGVQLPYPTVWIYIYVPILYNYYSVV